ncbi:response regulator [Gemmatimonas sp.]|uniref:hybrid sensor histidine kinase/response regulator n=1 Tax=Gemmatimonas sp. TaxID=1962908 RepID=UPI00286CCCA2|nr:response regulator [Gemmatimonas sp.]
MNSAQFLEVADWLPDPLLMLTRDGTIMTANRAATRLLGTSADGLGGTSLTARVDGDVETIARHLRESSRAREPHPGAIALRTQGGATVPCRCSTGLFRPASDEHPALLVMRLLPRETSPSQFRLLNDRIEQLDREMGRRQAAEEERRKLEAQMLQTQKLESLGVLAGGIAHDFNNLLTGIIGFSDLARLELPHESSTRSYLDEAVNGARRAAELTQQMLAYSGKGKFVVGPVRITGLVEEITRLLEVSISKKCVLRYDLMVDQPPCLADATQLRQVIMNLIINASEAIGDRSGVISLTTGAMWCERDYLAETYLDEGLREGLYLTLEVADTGAGMSPEVRARIFDPFYTTKFTGRGLGLAAVLGIVRGHGGAIRVYSEAGRGTTFKILLPAATDAVMPNAFAAPTGDAWRGSGTVLVVDDEESVRALSRHMLERMGYEVVLAADGREGVAAFKSIADRTPVVLLDLTMPHLDGAATFREMRRIDPDVRVVLMSGYNEQSVTPQFAGKGLEGFVQKPFQYDELQATMKRVTAGDAVSR